MSTPATPATSNPVNVSIASKAPNLLYRFLSWLFDLCSRPQPVGRHLRRRDRAIRYHRRQVRGRIRLHRAVMVVSILVCVTCVVLTWMFFNTALIRPHCAPNTPFAGITVLTALFSAAMAIYAGCQLHGINAEARRFAEFYLSHTNEDGTINVDPASDHDYADRAYNGRVFVQMSEIYRWYPNQKK